MNQRNLREICLTLEDRTDMTKLIEKTLDSHSQERNLPNKLPHKKEQKIYQNE